VAGLVLLSTGADDEDPAGFRRRALHYADILSTDDGLDRFCRDFLAQERFSLLNQSQRSFVAACIRRQDRVLLAEIARKVLAVRVPLQDVRLDLPTLIVAGDRDPACVAAQPRLKEILPAAKTFILSECGHLCNIEHPCTVNKLITSFAADVGKYR
jgi:pimeloyl-ACP methyl ester carboxylesterase